VTRAPRSLLQRRDALTRIRAASSGILLAAVAITLTASLLTWHLNNGLPRERRTHDLLGLTQVDAVQLRALEARLITPGKVEARDTLASELILDDMATHARELADMGRAGETVPAVRGLIAAFRQLAPALDQQYQSEAKLIYRAGYLPARIQLDHVMGPANRAAQQRLELAERNVKIGLVLSILGAVLLILGLALRVNRVRAREIDIVRTADSELSERNELLLDSQRRVRSAERLYRQLVERLPGVTYISSPSSVGPTFISPQALELLGLTAEEFVSHPDRAMQVIHPDDREGVEANMEILRRDGGECVQEFRVVHPDGRIVWIGDDATVVAGEDDKPLHVQGYLRDITPLKDAEARQRAALEREQAANEKLRELGAMKDDFVALVSHELRTPLTSIRGYLELVLEGQADGLSKENGEFLGIVDRNAARLERLVDDLLFMARLGSGKLELSLQDTDLAALARESVGAARPRASAQAVELDCAVEEVPAVRGDPGRLGQLLDNLISNAVKFTPDGGHVDVRVFPQNGDVAIEVADTGIGISATEQGQLFQKFFRTSEAGERAIQGTGLGLSISKAIVEAHAGRIELESKENIGTTIRVLLPVAGTGENACAE
jgi:PAS domain S-box-containing protein